MRRTILVAASVLAVAACGRSAAPARTDADTLTRRQKDSIVSTMPIPGASRIRDAQVAADRAAERAAAHDTVH